MSEADMRDAYEARREANAAEAADRAAINASAERIEERHQNPGFAAELADWDLDDDLKEELGPRASGVWVFANRDADELELDLLNRNRAVRRNVSRTPGDLLKRHQNVHAVLEGTEGVHDPDYRPPATSKEKRDLREAYRAATARETLGIDGLAFDGLTMIRSESAQIDNENDSSGAKGRFKSILSR